MTRAHVHETFTRHFDIARVGCRNAEHAYHGDDLDDLYNLRRKRSTKPHTHTHTHTHTPRRGSRYVSVVCVVRALFYRHYDMHVVPYTVVVIRYATVESRERERRFINISVSFDVIRLQYEYCCWVLFRTDRLYDERFVYFGQFDDRSNGFLYAMFVIVENIVITRNRPDAITRPMDITNTFDCNFEKIFELF